MRAAHVPSAAFFFSRSAFFPRQVCNPNSRIQAEVQGRASSHGSAKAPSYKYSYARNPSGPMDDGCFGANDATSRSNIEDITPRDAGNGFHPKKSDGYTMANLANLTPARANPTIDAGGSLSAPFTSRLHSETGIVGYRRFQYRIRLITWAC